MILDIKPNLYGFQLKLHLAELKRESSMSKLVNELENLCRIQLDEFGKEKIKFEEILDFPDIEKLKNKEIIARWYEYLFRNRTIDKKLYLQKSVSLYIDIYEETQKPEYFIHSLSLIKTARGIFREKMTDIYEKSKNVFEQIEYPFIQKLILQELISIFPKKTKDDFESYLQHNIENQTNKNNYSGVIHSIESLKIIKAINIQEYRIMLAENFEREGDFQSKNKKTNTFYPLILWIYEKALRQLKNIDCPRQLKDRIEKKVIAEQKEKLRMFSAVGNSFSDINKSRQKKIDNFGNNLIEQLKIKDFSSGFLGMMSISIPTDLSREFTIKTKDDKEYEFAKHINGYNRIDSKGKVVGKMGEEKFNEIFSRELWRDCIINFIFKTKRILDKDRVINKETIYYLLFNRCDNLFVPENRKILFAEGVFAGFSNDFILAAHILVPQIENSLTRIMH
ncbi:MAG: hypothetical protein JXL97_16245 [Bacteroidales bacterium]|nr:hypothetical protein [Bacteroidales bacterium]